MSILWLGTALPVMEGVRIRGPSLSVSRGLPIASLELLFRPEAPALTCNVLHVRSGGARRGMGAG